MARGCLQGSRLAARACTATSSGAWGRALDGVLAVVLLVALAAPAAAFAAPAAHAQDPAGGRTEPEPAPAGDAAAENDPMLETAREAVRTSTVWLARGIDSWFGDRPFEAGGKVSEGQLSIGLFRRAGERADVNVRLQARLNLPNLGDSGFAFLGRDNPREVISDTPGAVTQQDRLRRESRDDREFLAGIGVALREAFDIRLGLRGGLKLYLQARYHEQWQPDEIHLIEFRQTFFLTKADQLGSTTALSIAHVSSPVLVLRWLNAATITQRTRRYDWSSLVGAYRAFGDGRQLSFEALASGVEGSGVAIDDAGLLLKWEQPVLRNWLVGEVMIGRFWPRPDPAAARTSQWAAGLGVRVSF